MPRPKQVARKLGSAPRKQLLLHTKAAKIAFDRFVKPHIAEGGEEFKVTKKRRSKPGMKAKRIIKRYEGYGKVATKLEIQSLPFERLVRDIAANYAPDARFSSDAIVHLQCALELRLDKLIKKAYKIAVAEDLKSVSAHQIRVVKFSRED